LVTDRIRKIYERNVNVYASLQTMQPIRVFVTGFVNRPGLYDGLSSDSPLYYLDKAGGIDPARGSYIDLKVMRSGRTHKVINLYDFLLTGKMEYFQMVDGDTILVGPAKHRIAIDGKVDNPYQFEFSDQKLTGEQIIDMARPLPDATHAIVRRMTGNKEKSMYLTLTELRQGEFFPGDNIEFTYDKKKSTIVVRVEGEFSGEQIQVMPENATLAQLLQKVTLNPRADIAAIQLFRLSIAERQKELIAASLDNLQTKIMKQQALSTKEDKQLEPTELESLAKFIKNAKHVEPKGQIVVGGNADLNSVFLEDGDTIKIPSRTPLVMTHGEVRFPSVLVLDESKTAKYYIDKSAGFSDHADAANVLVIHNDGVAQQIPLSYKPVAGDEIIVMPKVEAHTMHFVKDVSQVLFQLGMASRVVTLLRVF
jgi:protein involved in polysaccharide export with SLBB domain